MEVYLLVQNQPPTWMVILQILEGLESYPSGSFLISRPDSAHIIKLIQCLLSRQLLCKLDYTLWTVFGADPLRLGLEEFGTIISLNFGDLLTTNLLPKTTLTTTRLTTAHLFTTLLTKSPLTADHNSPNHNSSSHKSPDHNSPDHNSPVKSFHNSPTDQVFVDHDKLRSHLIPRFFCLGGTFCSTTNVRFRLRLLMYSNATNLDCVVLSGDN
ncbi:hypothetical protein HID58_038027 [Brassica napus]|uniref:DUF1985 domain-containing protein n=2 Tax=Brassica TaxID=3705 RepID=A0ABQ8BN03_BRANA|nr:hypothetical protein HID58_038027 [Brassica napus]